MTAVRYRMLRTVGIIAASLPLVGLWPRPAVPTTKAGAGRLPQALTAAVDFPASLASGITGSVVPPSDTTSTLHFEQGTVAVGVVPIPPVPLAALRRTSGRLSRDLFPLPLDAPPHARLVLEGVTGADGMPATTAGALVIDAAVSPAAAGASPFSLPFDIQDGTAFLDAALPIQPEQDGTVRVEIHGVSVRDADGNVFGVLGFSIAPPAPTPTPGPCESGGTCGGPCPFTCPDGTAVTGECMTLQTPDQPGAPHAPICACEGACPQPTPSTPGPNACGGADGTCDGPCTATCPDGSVAAGKCVPLIYNGPTIPVGGTVPPGGCQCITVDCPQSPTPTPGPNECAGGETCDGACTATCPDGSTAAGQCESVIYNGPILPGSGPFPPGCQCVAPCSPPPILPHGSVCCQCGTAANECFDLQWVEATPSCPDGCTTVLNGTCDQRMQTCSPPTPCTADSDCDDDNTCTTDRCIAGFCEHDCLCLAPGACGPGPLVVNPAP